MNKYYNQTFPLAAGVLRMIRKYTDISEMFNKQKEIADIHRSNYIITCLYL